MERDFENGSRAYGQRFHSDLTLLEGSPAERWVDKPARKQAVESEEETPRQKLVRAQKRRDARLEKLERAQTAVRLSAEMTNMLEAQLSKFSHIGSIVTEECVASIRRSIDGVERPQMEFSPEIMAVWQQVTDIEKRLAAAKKAGEILKNELEYAKSALRDAESRVQSAALAVAAVIVEPIAEELALIESRAAILRRILLGYSALRHAGQFLPLSKKAAVLLRGQKAAHDPKVIEHWGAFLEELDRNPDACFVVKEFS